MASEARNTVTVAAINAAVSSAENLYSPPEERRWKVIWARYWCFKSHKREKRIVPAARSEGASGSAREWPTAQAGLGFAPPSSPASFVNSTAQSPASFTLSLSAASASMCSPGRPNTMFTIGPYAHETQLVSPPVFSTFTTEPSTAPLTPPPELAHLTNPSSPDVPFAQYITSSLEAKRAVRETISPLSTSNLASPCDTPVSYTPTSTHYYLGSPVGRLVSPALDYSSGEVICPDKYPSHALANGGQMVSSFPTYDPYASANFDGVPFASFILPSDTISKCDEQPTALLVQASSALENGRGALHNEVGAVRACEHGASSFHKKAHETVVCKKDSSSLHEEVCETFVYDRSDSVLQKDAGEALEAQQAKLELPQDHGANSSSISTVSCNSNEHSRNQDVERTVDSCSGFLASEAFEKDEILLEFSAHEHNEVAILPDTDAEGTLASYQTENVNKHSGKVDSTLSGEGPALTSATGQSDNFLCGEDPLLQVEMRAVLFQLDDIPE